MKARPLFWLLGPAIALMRNCGFPVKAGIIGLATAVPTALLLVLYWQINVDVMASSRLELDGLHYFKALYPTVRQARLLRATTMQEVVKLSSDSAKARQDLDGLVAKLDELQPTLGARLGTAMLLQQAKAALLNTPTAADNLFKVYAGHNKHVEAWNGLMDAVMDNSGLALDPDPDSYYAMLALLDHIPKAIDTLARLSSLSAAVSATGQNVELATAEIARVDALSELHIDSAFQAVRKVRTARPDLAAQLDPGDLPKRVAALRDLATDSPGAGGMAQARKIEALRTALGKDMLTYSASLMAALEAMLEARIAKAQRHLALAVAVVALAVAAAVYLFYAFAYSMNAGLRAIRRTVDDVAQGDLKGSTDVLGRDEVAGVLTQADEMRKHLGHTLGKVQLSSDHVASISQQLSVSTEDLGRRTELTAAQLEKTASSMEEIQSTVSNTAHHTREAAQLAEQNAGVAAEGGQVIGDVVSTMQRIQDSARTINDIVGLIDSIAFQTNILALNAAVEAARAGEQGKGFAVVAAEVRSLAQRSAGAAKEIKTLIGASVALTEGGVKIVGQAGETIQAIVASANRMKGILGDISRATEEQTAGIGLVNGAIAELDQMTQQNAALVEQTMAAATNLMEEAAELAGEAAKFKVPEELMPTSTTSRAQSQPIEFF